MRFETIDLTWKLAFAIIASILAVAANVNYVAAVLRGKVQPHTYTWMIWTLVSCIVFFGQLAKGAGVGSIPTAAAEIFTLIVFILSFKYGYRAITRSDTAFLVVALAAIVPWILTSDPTLSVVIAVGIDFIAFLPTYRKGYLEPRSENLALFSTNAVRHVFAILALESYNTATMLHSIVMIGANVAMATILIVRRKQVKNEKRCTQIL